MVDAGDDLVIDGNAGPAQEFSRALPVVGGGTASMSRVGIRNRSTSARGLKCTKVASSGVPAMSGHASTPCGMASASPRAVSMARLRAWTAKGPLSGAMAPTCTESAFTRLS